MKRRAAAIALWASLWLSSVAAIAQTSPPAAKIEEQLKRGQALIVERKFTEAADSFETAYRDLGATIFLYNAAVSAEMAQDLVRATARYDEFLGKEPNDPGAAGIRAHVASLKSAVSSAPAQAVTAASIRSVVKIDSDPTGAPVSVYERTDPAAGPFTGAEPPAGWTKVGDKPFSTPAVFSLKVGHYHVLIEPFKDYKASTADLDVAPGYVHELRASLSQGSFLAFLRVSAPVEGAKIYLDRPPSATAPVWGRTPKADFIEGGEHAVWIEAPGYEPYQQKVRMSHGETIEVRADLKRLPFGFVRFDSARLSRFSVDLDNRPSGGFDWQKGPYKVQLDAGLHRVLLKADGKKDYQGFVDVPAGQVLDIHARFEDKMTYEAPIALAVLAAGCGVGTGIAAAHAKGLPASDKQRSTFENLTIAGAIGAGVFAAASIFFFIDFGSDSSLSLDKPKEFDAADKEKDKKPAVTGALAPFFGPDAGGLSVRGSF